MKSILGIQIEPQTKQKLHERVEKDLNKKFLHIATLNPEIVVQAFKGEAYRKILNQAEVKIADGVGLIYAAKFLDVPIGERITGVDLMKDMLEIANKHNAYVLIIGGYKDVADRLARKLSHTYQDVNFMGIEGIKDIKNPMNEEFKAIQLLISEFNPHMLFVAYGAPYQEQFIQQHKEYLKNCICMGVGGAVDFLAGDVTRAPKIMRATGFEWLYRLISQPWRWKRQTKLLEFIWLVFVSKFRPT